MTRRRWNCSTIPLPAATSTRAIDTTRRIPKRSISAAANGDVRPYRMRLTDTAAEIVVRDHTGDLSLNTVSGELAASGALTRVQANSVSGELALDAHLGSVVGQAGDRPVEARGLGHVAEQRVDRADSDLRQHGFAVGLGVGEIAHVKTLNLKQSRHPGESRDPGGP